ncbi:hypothetical protein UlMin_022976 [Ulmus minor]
MPQSPECLLQLLQRFFKNRNQIKQIHCLLITEGHLLCEVKALSNSKWMRTLLYNTLIRAHLGFGQAHHSLILFTQMLSHQATPNSHTFPSLIKAASSSSHLLGTTLHNQALKRGVLSDPFVQTSFVNFYAHYGKLSDALKMFDEIAEPCIVANNAMLDAFCKNGDMGSALFFFKHMPERDVVSWSSVSNGFRRIGNFSEAIQLFKNMMSCLVRPNEAAYVSLLSSCANLEGWGPLYLGRQIHGYITRNETKLTVFMGTALVDLYGKSGCLNAASNIFDRMLVKEICTWNAMISALSSNGREKEALDMFERMKMEGFQPNEVTFVAILTGCARSKFVELGLKLFRSMTLDFGIVPVMEHYGCIADLLGRAGLLREATNFIKSMPFEADASVVGALVGACKIYGTIKLTTEVGQELLALQPQHCGRYVVLSNINAAMERWDRAADLRRMMVNAGIQKIPAYSVIG